MMVREGIEKFCIVPEASIEECMKIIDGNKQGIALVVDEKGKLVGTITDGDIRRHLLRGGAIGESVNKVMHSNPFTAKINTQESEIRDMMLRSLVRNIPIIDNKGRPCKVLSLSDLVSDRDISRTAVIMAGGEGRRLRPLTEHVPKPMLSVNGRPVIESIILALADSGIQNVYISTYYKADVIEDYFGNGSRYNLRISYLREKKKLGTAGGLSLLPERPTNALLVVNGDVITEANFSRLIDFHAQNKFVMTVGAIRYSFTIPYGVLQLAGHYLLGLEEKPSQKFFCNAGIYMINPEILSFIPDEGEFNMTDLIRETIRRGLPVTTFPIHERWIDIGRLEDLNKVQKE